VKIFPGQSTGHCPRFSVKVGDWPRLRLVSPPFNPALKFLRFHVDKGARLFSRRGRCAMATTNLRKAAVLLTNLPERQAARLFEKLAPEQMSAVFGEMAEIGKIGPSEQEAVLREFVAAGPQREKMPRSVNDTPFQFMHEVDVERLSTLIEDERPQTIALILSHLPAQRSAEVVGALPPDRQASVLRHIAKMVPPAAEIVCEVANSVRRRLNGSAEKPASDGLLSIVQMLNTMKPVTERKLLFDIAQADPELLQAIRCAMFGADVAACDEWKYSGVAC